jgi:hypothetical protein
MKPKNLASILPFIGLLLSAGCDEGLAPLNEPSGFSGVIYFKNWPPPDSVQELRIVAFLEYPADSASILQVLIEGGAAIYPQVGTRGLTQYVDSLPFVFTSEGTLLKATTYKYVAIAHKYGSNILTDWRPAAVYAATPSSFDPIPLSILLHRITPGVNFYVDFHNPPPKPWR